MYITQEIESQDNALILGLGFTDWQCLSEATTRCNYSRGLRSHQKPPLSGFHFSQHRCGHILHGNVNITQGFVDQPGDGTNIKHRAVRDYYIICRCSQNLKVNSGPDNGFHICSVEHNLHRVGSECSPSRIRIRQRTCNLNVSQPYDGFSLGAIGSFVEKVSYLISESIRLIASRFDKNSNWAFGEICHNV